MAKEEIMFLKLEVHFTYNAITKKFQKVWIDSEHGWMILYEGNKEEGLVVFKT